MTGEAENYSEKCVAPIGSICLLVYKLNWIVSIFYEKAYLSSY